MMALARSESTPGLFRPSIHQIVSSKRRATMVNYHDPSTIAQDTWVLVRLWHVANGFFIWEFFSTLQFEREVLRGIRPYRWTIWLYSIARVCTLMAVVLSMVGFDTSNSINCQAWATFLLLFSYIGNICASLLIVHRVIAIWKRDKVVSAIFMGILMIDIGFMINATARFRSTWLSQANTCVISFDSISLNLSTGAIFVTDIMLLSTMLIGLLRMRREATGVIDLGTLAPFLWKQGFIWILIASVFEISTVVFMILDLNVPFSLMFQHPCMIVTTIAATRMYRSLCSTDICRSPPGTQGGVRAVTDISSMRVRTGPIPLDQMVLSKLGPTPQSSYVSSDTGRCKAHEVSIKSDVESNPEK